MSADTPQVLVVGAGPVGSALALELAHHGVRSIVVDRSLTASRHPKMDFVNARSMELFGRLKLTDEIRELGVPSDHAFNFLWTEEFTEPPISEWSYPSVDELRAQATNDGTAPREPYQRVLGSLLEELGRRKCRANPLIDIREGWKFQELTQDESGVTTRITQTATGLEETIKTRYLVGCDGAGSAVRQKAGITSGQFGPEAQHCDVYFRSRDPKLLQHGRFFLTIASRGLTLVARDGSETWTGTFPLPGDEPFDGDPIPVIQERLGLDFSVDEILTVAHWTGRLAVADSYRAGAVFVAGDAAHQFFPTGGHGANTGLGDAFDLGWKLAAVLNGWAGPALLDSYEAERRPVALFNREMCFNLLEVWRRYPALAAEGATKAQLAGFLEHERYQINNIGIHFGYRYTTSPVIWHEDGAEPAWDWARIVPTTWPGSRLPSVRVRQAEEAYDLLGPELTLFDTSGSNAGKPLVDEAARLGVPLAHVSIDDENARAVWERDLVLVRPDHHVAWRGDEPPQDCTAVLNRVRGIGTAGPVG